MASRLETKTTYISSSTGPTTKVEEVLPEYEEKLYDAEEVIAILRAAQAAPDSVAAAIRAAPPTNVMIALRGPSGELFVFDCGKGHEQKRYRRLHGLEALIFFESAGLVARDRLKKEKKAGE